MWFSRSRKKTLRRNKFFFGFFLLFFGNSLYGAPTAEDAASIKYRSLVERYAPVWVQEISRKPAYDVITKIDFDGDWKPRNNVAHVTHSELPAVVYGDVLAETSDSYYLLYAIYHVADYDEPLREFFIPSSYHDNDYEGAFLLIDKATGSVEAIETWFHSRFLQFGHVPLGGTQTIDGRIHVEDETHPILMVQPLGHGVRSFQKIDDDELKEKHQIYRFSEHPDVPLQQESEFVGYILTNFDELARYATGPFGDESLFDEPQDFGIGEKPLGKYFSGAFKGDSSWARPKPPWSWSDHFDNFRPGAMFFHPARVFNRHFQLKRSETYLYHYGLSKIVSVEASALDAWVDQPVASYFDPPSTGFYGKNMRKIRNFFYRITEYLFYVFA